MTKQIKDGKEVFDGEVVKLHEGRFSGSFPLPEEDGIEICNSEQFTFIVTVRAEAPKFTRVRKTLELKRQNTFKVEASVMISPDMAKYLYDNCDVRVEGVNSGLIEAELTTFKPEASTEPSNESEGLWGTEPHETDSNPLESHTEGVKEDEPHQPSWLDFMDTPTSRGPKQFSTVEI